MDAPASTLSQFDIRGRSGLVTGAASGIGLAYAEMLAEAGARVTLSDIDGDAAEREAARLRGQGFEARAARLDVTSTSTVPMQPIRSELTIKLPKGRNVQTETKLLHSI